MKLKKEDKWRLEGMAYAVDFLNKHNDDVNALRKDVKMRGAYQIPMGIDAETLKMLCEMIAQNCIQTMGLIACATLRDEFGFGNCSRGENAGRIDRFIDRFNLKADALDSDLVSWEDLRNVLQEETGFEYKYKE